MSLSTVVGTTRKISCPIEVQRLEHSSARSCPVPLVSLSTKIVKHSMPERTGNLPIAPAEPSAHAGRKFNAIPANKDAQGVITEPYLKSILASYNKAPFVSQYLDTLLGQNVGNAMNTGVVDLLAGKSDAAGIIKSVNEAAAKG